MVNSALGLNGKQLMTNPAPGQYVIAYQDASGKNSIWKASLEDDIFAFTVSVIFQRERDGTMGSIIHKSLKFFITFSYSLD